MREGAKLTSHCAIPPWPQAATVRTAAQNAQQSTQEPPSKRGVLSGAVDDRGVEFATDDLAEHARGQHGGTATFALRISSARAPAGGVQCRVHLAVAGPLAGTHSAKCAK